MMTPRRSFPIAAKLTLGFLVAVLLPTAILSIIFLTARQDIDRRNVESYVQQVGQRQRQVLTTSFARARETLASFVTARDINGVLVGVLLSEVQSTPQLPTAGIQEVSRLMAEQLLDPTNTVFEDVRLLNREGFVIASAGDELPGAFGISQDASNSTAYLRITAAQQADAPLDQVVVVTQRGEPVVEIASVIHLRDTENIIGYLVATANLDILVEPTLGFVDDTFPTYSFLQSQGGVTISLDDTAVREYVALSNNTLALERARGGEVGVNIYPLDGGAGEMVGGYFAPIQGTPLILITEVPIAAVLRQPTDYFGAWGFVLVTGTLSLVVIAMVFAYNSNFVRPIDNLRRAIQAASVGNYDEPVPDVNRWDEFGELSRTFVDMRDQTRNVIQELQNRIDSRARDVATTQEIGRVAVSQRDLQQLMDDVVKLITERFANIYHAQIFLLDGDRRFAVLRASTGEVGQQLLARGHRLSVGSISVIGQVTSQGEVIIARDTAVSEVHRSNEFLSETRAELAVPLRIGERVIGALDVQSRESDTFDEDQVRVLQIMAAQIAIAIENAQLYQESIRRIRSIQEQSRDEAAKAWQDYMFDQRTQQIVRQTGSTTDLDVDTLRQRVMESGKEVIGEMTDRETIPVAIPIKLRERIIGVVTWELPAAEYDNNKVQLAQDLVDRLALSLDNTRLFEQSQRATKREQMVNEIAAKLTVQTNVNEILQTAVKEVGQALRAPQVSIRLSRNDLPNGNNSE